MRKKILSFCLIVISISVYSQNKNFTIEDNLIYWKLVYEDSSNVSELRNSPRLEFKTDSTGYVKKGTDKGRKLSPYTADFKIEKKIGKYRVSVFNIVGHDESPITLNFGNVSAPTPTEYRLESTLINKKGKIKKTVWGVDLTEIYNENLTELFTIKKKPKSVW